MPLAAPRAFKLPPRRVWALFTLFVALWALLRELNRPEPHYGDQPLSYWLERMADERTALHASTVVSEMGPEAVPALVHALRTTSSTLGDAFYAVAVRLKLAAPRNYDAPNIRATAAYLLGRMGEGASEAAPELVLALGDEDGTVRFRAHRALSRIGMVAAPQAAHALQDRESVVRYGAAKALGGMGGEARYAVPALMAALRDPSKNVRDAAFEALAQIGERAQPDFSVEFIPDLALALTNSISLGAKKFAIQTLRKIGPPARSALPNLNRAREDSPELAAEIQQAVAAISK